MPGNHLIGERRSRRCPWSGCSETGRRQARRLLRASNHLRGDNVVVLGLPRGGVPVAFEIAEALDAPLDVIVVRKVGAPGQPELAMGAIGERWRPRRQQRGRPSGRGLRGRLRAGRTTSATSCGGGPSSSAGPRLGSTSPGAPRARRRRHRHRSTARAACHVARAHGAARVSVPPYPSPRLSPFVHCPMTPTRSSSSSNRRGCARSASGTTTSDRSTTRPSSTFSNEQVEAARRRERDRMRNRHRQTLPLRWTRRWMSTSEGLCRLATSPFPRVRSAPCRLRPRQRQQPPQPEEPVRGRSAQRRRPGDADLRPPHRRRSEGSPERVRHRPPRRPASYWQPTGCAASTLSPTCRSHCSAPARVPQPPVVAASSNYEN